MQEVGALGEVLRAHGPSPEHHGQARQGEQRRPRGGPSQVSIPTRDLVLRKEYVDCPQRDSHAVHYIKRVEEGCLYSCTL